MSRISKIIQQLDDLFFETAQEQFFQATLSICYDSCFGVEL